MLRRRERAREGVAAVEAAVVTTFLLVPLMIGVWEVGRMVQVQQIVSNSAREGARVAAQGYATSSSGMSAPVTLNAGSPNVADAVFRYLQGAGLTTLQKSDVTVTFQFLAPRTDGAPAAEPYQGEKGQPFAVTVTIPWDKVRWVNLGVIQPAQVSFTVTWRMLVDDPFTVDTTLPTW